MAGNFWQSSHFQQWLLDRDDLIKSRLPDLQFLSEEEYQKMHIFYANFIQALGEQLKLRQQVVATATVYFRRFYSKNSFKSIDPLIVAPTCIFLASKVEEFGPISNNRLITACTSIVKSKFTYALGQDYPYRINHILECEFYLLEAMDCCLIVYLPYRPLTQYISDLRQKDIILPVAWKIVNDCLRTDLILLQAPFYLALAAIHMACVIQQSDDKQWFAELAVDMEKILEVTRHMLALYDMWKNFDERKEIPEILKKCPKPNPQNTSQVQSQAPSQPS